MLDPWKELRQDCFGNVEPAITLQSYTQPDAYGPATTESLPALAASISYDSKLKSFEQAYNLNRKLIKMNHLTPLESVQFNFRVWGISKICGAQMSRHRIGQGHISGSRRFRKQEAGFIYPLLDYIKTEDEVRSIYGVMSAGIQDAYERAEQLKQEVIGVKKSDARYLIPASTANERNWWINARALRSFFQLRLASNAEWEIRRIAFLILDSVMSVTPSLFEDIAEQFNKETVST